jgi:PhnB protein
MSKSKLARPDGHHTITPSFVVPNTAKVITFLEKAFGAKTVDRYDGPNGAVMHAELRVGDSVVMCGEPMGKYPPMPAALSFYVDDGAAVDATFKAALAAGAKEIEPPRDQPWGYRSASIEDPGGNRWSICAVVELVSRDEILRRMQAQSSS